MPNAKMLLGKAPLTHHWKVSQVANRTKLLVYRSYRINGALGSWAKNKLSVQMNSGPK